MIFYFTKTGPVQKNTDLNILNCSAINPEDYRKFMERKKITDFLIKFFLYLHDLADMCFKPAADILSPYRSQNHEIRFKPDSQFSYKRAYAIIQEKLIIVKKYID